MTVMDRITVSEMEHSDSTKDLVPVFVYGTLRLGHNNFSWAQDAVVYALTDCTAEGTIYFVSPGGGYPVAKFDEVGTIIGDVLWFDPKHPEYNAVVQMEINAGYELRSITITHPDGTKMQCLTFHYLRKPGGPRIEDGDWAKAVYG